MPLAEQNQAAELLLTKCTNLRCGHTFYSRNQIFVGGNSRNITVTGTKVLCERCGSWAAQQDWNIDSQGNFQLRDIINEIRSFDNVVRLKEFKEHVTEAANDEFTAEEFADVLSEVDPRFTRFKSLIKSLSKEDLNILMHVITLVIILMTSIDTWGEQEEANELTKQANSTQQKSLVLQQKQYELEQHKYETEQLDNNTEQRVSELEKQIESLINSLENKQPTVTKPQNAQPSQPIYSAKSKCNLKGNLRNTPCKCGSGIKAKKCHPNGYQFA